MPIIWTLLQAAWIVVFIAIAVFTIRFVYRRSKLLGTILVAGTVVHTIVPAIFFSISWFNLPVLRELHTGDGFWVIAPDARTYFALASKASAEGLHTILQGSPSPSFIQAIAVWMDLVGVSPGSPLFFNLIAFVLTCGLIVRLGMSVPRNVQSQRARVAAAHALVFADAAVVQRAGAERRVFRVPDRGRRALGARAADKLRSGRAASVARRARRWFHRLVSRRLHHLQAFARITASSSGCRWPRRSACCCSASAACTWRATSGAATAMLAVAMDGVHDRRGARTTATITGSP